MERCLSKNKRRSPFQKGVVKVDSGIYFYKSYTIQKWDRMWKFFKRPEGKAIRAKSLINAIEYIDAVGKK